MNHDGEIKERELYFICNNGSFSHIWTWHLSTFHSNSWVFILSPSWSTFMSHVIPLSHFRECIVHIHIMSWYLPRQVKAFRSSIMLFNVQRKIVCWELPFAVKPTSLLSWFTLIHSCGYFILNFHNFVSSFVSLMWDSSWPSFDETILVSFNTSLRNSSWKQVSTLISTCLNGRFPCFR